VLLEGLELETSMPWIRDGWARNLRRASSAKSSCCDMPVGALDKLGQDDELGVGAPCKLPLEGQGALELELDVQVCHIWWRYQRHPPKCLHIA